MGERLSLHELPVLSKNSQAHDVWSGHRAQLKRQMKVNKSAALTLDALTAGWGKRKEEEQEDCT